MQFNHLKSAVLALSVVALTACQTTPKQTTKTTNTPDLNQMQAIPSNGLRARISVAQFTDKSNNRRWWNKEIGNGMADQLTTALVGTNRFIVLERANLSSVLAEQDLAASGRVSQETGAAWGEIEGAEIAVIASVTEFDDGSKGANIGGGGLFGDVVNSVSAGFSSTHIAVDLRLVDTRTSRILFATSVEGGSDDYNFSAAATNFGGSLVGGDLSSWSNTPKEKALREIIEKTVNIMLAKVPESYYHYNQQNVSNRKVEAAPQVAQQKPTPQAKPVAVKPKKKAAPKAVAYSSDRPLTQYEKTDIAYAQQQLTCLGYLEDEDYEPEYSAVTVGALQRFQGHYELEATGRVDDATYNALTDTGCLAKSFANGLNSIADTFGGNNRRGSRNSGNK